MKRFLQGALTLFVIVGLGTLGLFTPAAQQLISLETSGGGEEIAGSCDFVSTALAAATIGLLNIAPEHLTDKSMNKSALRLDREKVEVLARSVTFPGVLQHGELLINVDFPTTTLLCFEVGYYAGQAGGLILAMDRDTVIEQRLYWIIDAADDLFYWCEAYLYLQAFTDKRGNDRNQRREIKERLAEQIQMIQTGLRFALNVTIKTPAEKLG